MDLLLAPSLPKIGCSLTAIHVNCFHISLQAAEESICHSDVRKSA